MAIQELIDWYKTEVDRLKMQIVSLEAGKEWHQTLDASGQWVDTTDSQLDDTRRRVDELDALVTSWSGQSLSTE